MITLSDPVCDVLADTRRRTLEIVGELDRDALEAVHSPLLSPLVWDLGHIAAFEDLWIARTFGTPLVEPQLTRVYDADETPRAERGSLPFLRTDEAHDFLSRTRANTLRTIAERDATERERGLELIVRHELQHGETMLQTLQIAGLPCGLAEVAANVAHCVADGLELVAFPGGEVAIGSERAAGFSYDNEQPRHRVELAPFSIGRSPVSNGAWQRFVDAGGYERRELWSEPGWAWRVSERVQRPLYWSLDGTRTEFAGSREIEPTEPVCHISLFEAEAFAADRGARLPTEFEWEAAATSEPIDGIPRPVGMGASVWQWTATTFHGYPGFRADPYPEYSEQFFGRGYRVLRGGARFSSPRVATPQFRNWDLPQRRQIFSGLRLARDV